MTPDLWIGLITLAILFALEGVIPFYTARQGRLRHGLRNLTLAGLNGLVGAAMAPILLYSDYLTGSQGWGLCPQLGGGLACAIGALVVFDLWMYAWHRANHEIPLLWRLHRVHHTDPSMDSTTAVRFHPGELVLSTLFNAAVLTALGMTLELFVVYKSVMLLVIVFHHSNVRVPARLDRALRVAIVPPSMHRVHHSEIPAETNSNYGTVLSVWDRVFGSFRLRADLAQVRFGIGAFAGPAWQGPVALLLLPLRRADRRHPPNRAAGA